MITIEDAEKIVLTVLPEGTTVIASAQYKYDYLFVVNNEEDILEGNLDPFFKVNALTGEFCDFSPMQYPDPSLVWKQLGF